MNYYNDNDPKMAAWLRELIKQNLVPAGDVYVLSERPSFTGKGTDATAYAWFVWSKYREPKIQVI